ncbi:hypothetical protein K8R14_04570 [bacterium]|nr:hypothetical protein [bacterium]
MEQNLLDNLKQIHSEVIKNYKAIPKLTELQAEANKAFDKRIEQLLSKKDLVRKIKVPKIHIKLWKHKDKRIKIPINWKYLLSAPFIYGMFTPSVVFHIAIEIYHQICFRLYGIPLVDSKEYFIYDRQLFDMLNTWEKINCKYCSYINNLIRYSAEIGGRTERYWCPIKYYRRVDNVHSQYTKFVDGDDEKEMREKWEELRDFSDLE